MTESAPLSTQQGGITPSPGRPQPPARTGRERPDDTAGTSPAKTTRRVVAAVCPFLVANDGAWRSAAAAREHRCGATDPPARLPIDRQQRVRLGAGHLDCPLFEVAAGLA